MPTLLDILQTGKLHWLTVPRYAVITLPLAPAGGLQLAGYGMAALVPLCVSALGFARLVWLKRLPHESARLAEATQALAAAQPDRAIVVLQRPLPFGGMNYQVQRAVFLAHAYLRNGQFIEAHRILNGFNEQHLQHDERLRLRCAWSWLFLEAENPGEARRRLEDIPEKDCMADIGCLLLKAEIELRQECFAQARARLETGVDCTQEAKHRVRLLNNLARLEGLQGRLDTQLRYLLAARTEYRKAQSADLIDVVHHNLSIALVRAGRRGEAREVLREAWATGDATDLHHAITMHNNHLHAAREAGDAGWVREVHEEFERHLTRLPPCSPRERLALDVTQLRTYRNDGIPLRSGDYCQFIHQLLDRVDSYYPAITESDRVVALVEIRHDLKRELETVNHQAAFDLLIPLLQRAARLLCERRPTIEAHLGFTLSPKLIGPLEMWHRYRTDTDKAQIELAKSPEARHDAFTQMFCHLREKSEWLGEQGTARQAIESWLIVCDEYLACHELLPAAAHPRWRQSHLQLAQQALDQASALLEGSKKHIQHIDLMIGLAYFNLQLRQDATAAMRWVEIIEAHKPSLAHYAGWLREHYAYVCRVLAIRSTSTSLYEAQD